VLNDVERDCIVRHGYGLHSFVHALVDTFERLAVEPLTPAVHQTIHGFAQVIADKPVEVLADVPETLQYLTDRHHLILMTKGSVTEQMGKIERSGLKDFFAAHEIVAEKDPVTYAATVEKYGLARDFTWMVGNSPKSDINPALAAGLNAVFVPHDMTWVLEHEEIDPTPPGARLLQVERFSDLRSHF
jgi:putative hydrolase of the HAD superfamily